MENMWYNDFKRSLKSAKFAYGELNVLMHAKLPAVAKCASHANGEFNLATPKELFSYGAKRNNLALNEVQNLANMTL